MWTTLFWAAVAAGIQTAMWPMDTPEHGQHGYVPRGWQFVFGTLVFFLIFSVVKALVGG